MDISNQSPGWLAEQVLINRKPRDDLERIEREIRGVCPECGGVPEEVGSRTVEQHHQGCPRSIATRSRIIMDAWQDPQPSRDYDPNYQGKRGSAQWKQDAYFQFSGNKKIRRNR